MIWCIKTYIIAYVKTQKIRFIIHYVKPTAQLLFKHISNHMLSKVWDKITYPFPNLNGSTVEVWEWLSNWIPHYIMDVITYPCWDQS